MTVTYPILGTTAFGFVAATPFNVTKPAGIVDGDYMLMVISSQQQPTTDWTLSAGWTRLGQGMPNGTNGTIANVRIAYIYGKPVPSASAETATTYSVQPGAPTGQRYDAKIIVARGVDLTTPVTVVSDKYGTAGSSPPFMSLLFTASADHAGSVFFMSRSDITSTTDATFVNISSVGGNTWTQQYYESTTGNAVASNPGATAVSVTLVGVWTAPISNGQSPGTITWNFTGPFTTAALSGQAIILNAAAGSNAYTVTPADTLAITDTLAPAITSPGGVTVNNPVGVTDVMTLAQTRAPVVNDPLDLTDSIQANIQTAGAQIVGSGAIYTGTSGTGSVTLFKPGAVADADVLIAVIRSQGSTQGTEYIPPLGWTVISLPSSGNGSRINMIAYKVIPSAAAEGATNYTFTSSQPAGNRVIGRIYRAVNVDNSVPIGVASAALGSHASSGSAWTVPDSTDDGLLVAYYGATLAPPYDGTFVSMTGSGLTYNQYDYISTPVPPGDTSVSRDLFGISTVPVVNGQTLGVQNWTFVGPGSSSTVGFGFVLRSSIIPISWTANAADTETLTDRISTLLAPAGTIASNDDLIITDTFATIQGRFIGASFGDQLGITDRASSPVEMWMSNRPNYIAHRGGSVSYPEETLYAYKHAAAWNPNLALEVSIWMTADGVWVGSHDQTTGRVFGTNYDIPSTSLALLSTLRTTIGNQPIMQLTELLDLYGGKRVIVVDNKGGQGAVDLKARLDSFGGPDWFIMKTYYSGSGITNPMRAAGYKVWGYYYEGDQTSALPSTHNNFDILGMDYGASQAAWDGVMSYGQPVWAHILNVPASKTTADSKAAASVGAGATGVLYGYMVSGVTVIVPMVDTGNALINDWIDVRDSFGSTLVIGDPLPVDFLSITDSFGTENFLTGAVGFDNLRVADSFGSTLVRDLAGFYDTVALTDTLTVTRSFIVTRNDALAIHDYAGTSTGVGNFSWYTASGVIPLSVQGVYQGGVVVPCTFFPAP